MDISKVLALWNTESKSNIKKATKSDCKLWTGRGYGEKGYGLLKGGDVMILAHRAAWIAANMQEPEDRHIIKQSCGQKRCCLPEHLSQEYVGRV